MGLNTAARSKRSVKSYKAESQLMNERKCFGGDNRIDLFPKRLELHLIAILISNSPSELKRTIFHVGNVEQRRN